MRLSLLTLTAGLLVAPAAGAAPPDYRRDVQPLLVKNCTACHGPDKQRGGLRLDSAAAVRAGGNSGPAVVIGKGGDSRLIHAVTGTHDAKPMPPNGPRLTAEQVALLQAWIDAGAPAPAEGGAAAGAARSSHWAFQPVRTPEPPAVRDRGWVRNPIDAFILTRLEREGIRPSPEADRVTLIRRLSLDLLGLPPSPAEVDAFVNDPRPGAYEQLV